MDVVVYRGVPDVTWVHGTGWVGCMAVAPVGGSNYVGL